MAIGNRYMENKVRQKNDKAGAGMTKMDILVMGILYNCKVIKI
jgi:hypothetical protein